MPRGRRCVRLGGVAPGLAGAEPGPADEVSEQRERGPGPCGGAVAALLDLSGDARRAEDRAGGGGHPGRDGPAIQVGCERDSPDSVRRGRLPGIHRPQPRKYGRSAHRPQPRR